jgi:two-component system nitrate/nitrite response regulator NarL
MGKVGVVIADDHPLYREGIERALGSDPDLELLASCSNGRDAVAAIERLRPAVALLDLSMPDLDGLEVLALIKEACLDTRPLFLSGHLEPERVRQALAAGAAGYLLKDEPATEIRRAVAIVADGTTVISERVQRELLSRFLAADQHGPVRPLSPREREVLQLVADGHSNQTIGRKLAISPGSVKTHIRRACDKLGVNDRSAAVAAAIRIGILV